MICLYKTFGFNVLQEGDKYLTDAEALINGNFHKAFEDQTLYASYIIYLEILKALHLPNNIIFICTYSFFIYASLCFYKLIKEQINVSTAKIWLMFLACSPLIQFWQFTLFSEIFYISITFLFCYLLFKDNFKNRTLKVILCSLVLIFTRPSGIFTVIVLLSMYGILRTIVSRRIIISLAASFGLVLFLSVFFLLPLHYSGYAKEIMLGSIYCGFPIFTAPVLPEGQYTLWQCYHFLYENYGLVPILELFIEKTNSFLGLTRPYYTNFHNVINAVHYTFYFLGLYGIYKNLRHKTFENSFYSSLIIIILLNAFLVGLVFNEWSERYTVVIFPFVFLFASSGIVHLYKLIKTKIAV